jgi:Family of unknown function (DUF6516)
VKAREYYAVVQAAILAAPHVIRSDITFDEVTDSECYIRGILTMTGEIELHLAEYTITDPEIKRLKYRYHLQTLNGEMLARWDNAPHHPEVKSHPDHLHKDSKAHPSPAMDIENVLSAAIDFIE